MSLIKALRATLTRWERVQTTGVLDTSERCALCAYNRGPCDECPAYQICHTWYGRVVDPYTPSARTRAIQEIVDGLRDLIKREEASC